MRSSVISLPIVLLLGAPVLTQQNPAETKPPVSVRESRVQLPAATLATDEELLEIAKKANINVLIDASEMTGQKAASPERNTSLYSLLNLLAKERKTTWLQQDSNTFLLWSEPDFRALARSIAQSLDKPEPKTAGQPVKPQQAQPANPDEIVVAATPSLDRQLSDYFASLPAQGDAAKMGNDVPVSTLPAPLREAVIAAGRAAILGPQGLSGNAAWLSDEFWKSARLRIQNLNMAAPGADGKPTQNVAEWLFLGGDFEAQTGRRGTLWRSLGAVPANAPANAPVNP